MQVQILSRPFGTVAQPVERLIVDQVVVDSISTSALDPSADDNRVVKNEDAVGKPIPADLSCPGQM